MINQKVNPPKRHFRPTLPWDRFSNLLEYTRGIPIKFVKYRPLGGLTTPDPSNSLVIWLLNHLPKFCHIGINGPLRVHFKNKIREYWVCPPIYWTPLQYIGHFSPIGWNFLQYIGKSVQYIGIPSNLLDTSPIY